MNKNENFSNKVLIINGFNGTGKTILPPIIDAFRDSMIPTFSYELEWFSNLYLLEEISKQTFSKMILKILDYRLYNGFLGREMNTRFSDLSSIWKSTKLISIVRSIFNKNDEELYLRGGESGKILALTITNALQSFETFDEVLNERLLFVEFLRDPLYMYLQNLILYNNVINGDRRKDFTLRYHDPKSKNIIPPFFKEKEFTKKEYLTNKQYIYKCLENILDIWENQIAKNINNKRFLLLPFEKFVLNPNYIMKKLSFFFDEDYLDSRIIKSKMRKENVPRKFITQSRNQSIYKRYGLETIRSNSIKDEREKYKIYLLNKYNIEKEIVDNLDLLSKRYYNLLDKYIN